MAKVETKHEIGQGNTSNSSSSSSTCYPSTLLQRLLATRKGPMMTLEKTKQRIGFREINSNKWRYKGITATIGAKYCGEGYTSGTSYRSTPPKTSSLVLASHVDEDNDSASSSSSTSRYKKIAKGMNRGKAIDNELKVIVDGLLQMGSEEDFKPCQVLRSLVSPREDNKRSNYDIRTLNVIKRIVNEGWIPVTTQLIVSCKASRYATAIDLVCWNPENGKWVIGEHKSGYKREYKSKGISTNTMKRKGLAHIPNTTFNKHQLQLEIGILLFCYTFGVDRNNVIGVLLQTVEKQTNLFLSADWLASDSVRNTLEEDFIRKRKPRGSSSRKRKATIAIPQDSSSSSTSSSRKRPATTIQREPQL